MHIPSYWAVACHSQIGQSVTKKNVHKFNSHYPILNICSAKQSGAARFWSRIQITSSVNFAAILTLQVSTTKLGKSVARK